MSFSEPYRLIIIFSIISCLLLQEAQTLTEAQIKEVEKLRAELDVAFEQHEESEVLSKGVIVQPGWTKSSLPEPKVNAKVVVTDEGLDEAKRWREEIAKAVQEGVYVASAANGAQHVETLHKSFGQQQRSREVLNKMLGDTEDIADRVGASAFDAETAKLGPNIVEASDANEPGIDIRKLQRLEVSKRRTKEMLRLKYIIEDYHFTLGDDVLEWAQFWHNGKEYFLGRREHDLQIVRVEAMVYDKGDILNVGQPITSMVPYSYWNVALEQQEGVILVAAGDKIIWFRENNATQKVEIYWEWSIGRVISDFSHFTFELHDYLVVATNETFGAGYHNLNIYQFALSSREYWMVQSLSLQHACGKPTILDTGRDILLAVSQNNSAIVYSYNPHTESSKQLRFQFHQSFASEDIESVAAFQMGGRSYLALGGRQPQILLYAQGDFIAKTIFGQNFGVVELFFPIPVRTYRDDLILLVQHRVEFSTHTLTVLETLIWNGEQFEANLPVPCRLGSHTVYGVSCMLDIQRDEGLKGAALLKRGKDQALLVPRHNAESGLFYLHTEMLEQNSEYNDLHDIYGFLKDWVKEQDELIAQAQEFVADPQAFAAKQTIDLTKLEQIHAPELQFFGDVGEMYINQHRWTQEDTEASIDSVLRRIEQVGDQLLTSRVRRGVSDVVPTFDVLEIDELEVEELLLDMQNSEEFYIQHGMLNFDGILNFNSLEVLEETQARASEISQNMSFEGNLIFEEINGIPWQYIKRGLVFRNAPVALNELVVNNEVIVEDELTVNNLNELKFPEDYLWSSGPKTSVVQAKKTFVGSLAANVVETSGLINGVDPYDAITLSDPQDWLGFTTFANLEISERLELNGTAHGRGLDDFENNPTLQDSNIILAACSFAQLEVNGPVVINGKYDNIELAPLLADVVQRPSAPEEQINIPSAKTFSHIHFPIDFRVDSNKINNISTEEFVTLHTSQELNFSVLAGYVYFNNLTLAGTYDGVKVEELLQNALTVDAPLEATGTQLNFVTTPTVEVLEVLNTLNGITIATGYQTLQEDLIVKELHIDELQSKLTEIPGDIQGHAHLNGHNLHDFLDQRNWSAPADTGNIFVNELTLESGLVTDALHGIRAEFLLNFLDNIDELPEMILDGKIQVDHVLISGDVQVYKLNGDNFDEHIQLTAIWLNRPNYLSTSLKFEEPLELHGNVYCEGALNGQSLPDLIDDMVFKDDNATLLIQAPKNFLKNVLVNGNAKLDAVNGLLFNQIATKSHVRLFENSLRLKGNIIVNELELAGQLNDFSLPHLSSLLRYDQQLGAYVLLGENHFGSHVQLEDLTVLGDLNSFVNMRAFFENIIYKNRLCMLKGKNIFKGRVAIEKGAYVRSLNGINLLALLSNIVFTAETQPVFIKAPISFRATVKARDITVKHELLTTNLNGCLLQNWLNESLRVDQDEQIGRYLHFNTSALDGNAMFASFLNDINLAHVITLHTPQNLSQDLLLSEVHLNGTLYSEGPINGVDLQMEYANTLLTHGDQLITTPLTMQSCRVRKSLRTYAPVNSNKDLHQVATLHESLELRSPLFFQNVTARQLYTNDLVSGIDLDQWHETALWLKGRPQQLISGNWSARVLSVQSAHQQSPAGSDLSEWLRLPRADKDFSDICRKVVKLLKKRETRICFIKYLEEAFELDLKAHFKISKVFALYANDADYILLNADCFAYVYKWNSVVGKFHTFNVFDSGAVDQLLLVASKEQNSTLKFVTNAVPQKTLNCSHSGLNSWSIYSNEVLHVRKLGSNYTNIHQPRVFSPLFYAKSRQHGAIHEFSSLDDKTTNTWQFRHAVESAEDSYRFLPVDNEAQTEIRLSNGRHMLILTKNETLTKLKRASSFRLSLPKVSLGAVRILKATSESQLKPNAAAATRKLDFDDFSQVVERILHDLIYRLSLEVNITQLSIPESDLYDIHLVQDFIDIMQELKKQKIFPAATFADIKLEKLQLPANPAQVLAARTVQIIWPVIVEIEEVHSYLKENATHTHPVCARITKSLGMTVRDVLVIAYKNKRNKTKHYIKDLTAVIERIRTFQSNLATLAEELNKELKQQLAEQDNATEHQNATLADTSTTNESLASIIIVPEVHANATTTMGTELQNATQSVASIEPAESLLSTVIVSQAAANFTAVNATTLSTPMSELPSFIEGESLVLQVGAISAPRSLSAVTFTQPHLVAAQPDGIKLFTLSSKSRVFQTIAAHKPRALVSLRIHDETLLAFVEDCCLVRVMIYRGVQGFVELVHFTLSDKVENMVSVRLRVADMAQQRNFIAINMGQRVKFYEVILAGDKSMLAEDITCD